MTATTASRTALLAVVLTGCAPLRTLLQPVSAEERLAGSVTIVRDEWGVPTIYGPTDAAVAFGAAYAQAEDDFRQIEEDYIHALGRAAHYYGDAYLADDLLQAAFEVERLAREEYAREPAERREVWDAYVAGLNYYTRSSGVRPRLITRFEPWMLFARFHTVDRHTAIDGVRLGVISAAGSDASMMLPPTWRALTATSPITLPGVFDSVAAAAPARDAPRVVPRGSGAAVASARAESAHPLLRQTLDASFFGTGRIYELHLHSDQGWHVRGAAILGTPVPVVGFNSALAWTHTSAGIQDADAAAHEIVFDHPSDPLLYRADGDWRRAEMWSDTLLVNTMRGVEPRVYTFIRTHVGPVVALHAGRAFAAQTARTLGGGVLQQWYALGRAHGSDQFRAALAQSVLHDVSITYADTTGAVFTVAGAAAARDSSPGGAHRPLQRDGTWTLEDLAATAFDTYIATADDALASLVREWEEIGGSNPDRAFALDEPLDQLRAWDRIATVESPEATLFVLWQERLRSGDYAGDYRRFRAFEDVVQQLRRDWQSPLVPWGEVNRLQHPDTTGSQRFSDDRASLPVAGVPAWTGASFVIESQAVPAQRRRYATHGRAYTAVIELASQVRARSIVPFGQSADPASAHYDDQAPLFATGRLKQAWFTREDVMANAARVYRPGPPLRAER